MKNLHICYLEKFIPPFIDFVNEEFNIEENIFLVDGDRIKYPLEPNINIHFQTGSKFKKIFNLLKLSYTSKKIILHNLFDIKIAIFLFFQPWLLKKCYWVIWGADLYYHKLVKRSFSFYIKEFFRKPVIRRIAFLVSYIDGDVKLARQWYNAQGKYIECIMYLSNVFTPIELEKKTTNRINIQIGNSADPSNNHIETLNLLAKYKNEDIHIFIPLSYGCQTYAQQVIEEAKLIFGEKFTPLLDFMSRTEYQIFLSKIDIAIFNHRRQQGMGNIINLLGLGKKIFIRDDVSTWDTLNNLGIKCFNTKNIELKKMSDSDKDINFKIISEYFSKKKLKKQLEIILK